jgi:hypothetical protein
MYVRFIFRFRSSCLKVPVRRKRFPLYDMKTDACAFLAGEIHMPER